MSCPICKGALPADNKYRPFCSHRCQLIDLGNWLGERYVVPGRDAEGAKDEPEPPTAPADNDDRERSANR